MLVQEPLWLLAGYNKVVIIVAVIVIIVNVINIVIIIIIVLKIKKLGLSSDNSTNLLCLTSTVKF